VASLTLKLPDTLKDQAEETAEEKGYQSTSEYARQALREKLETDLVTIRDQEEMVPIDEAYRNLRKDAAVSKLEDIVEEEGVPAYWKTDIQKVREEMVEEDLISEDFSERKIYEYTRERRVELEQEHRGESQ
jgi:Arc/MetJ-type ribon-helix-helix transcriptional regulator